MKIAGIFLYTLFICVGLQAQTETTYPDVIRQIREEGFQHSQVADIAHYLTDVSGSRLTNSPGYVRASNWAVKTFDQWQLSNAAREPWGEFGKGWETNQCTVSLQSPYYRSIIAYPYGWSYGTRGTVRADVVAVSYADSNRIRSNGQFLKGKIVMIIDTSMHFRGGFQADAKRYADSDLVKMKNNFWVTREELEPFIGQIQQQKKFLQQLEDKGALVIITNDENGNDGTVHADRMESYEASATYTIPKLVCSAEDFYLMERLVKGGTPVSLEVTVKTRFTDEDLNGYNIVAEIPGTDKKLKDELVIMGGHLDSWYSGTGATDNGAGCAVMMEAIRIIRKLDLPMKRTIRIVLWGAEEQGLIGSLHYVKNHFGDPVTEELKADQKKVSAYYNLDNGSGKIRGIFLQENEAVRPIFEQWLKPFADLGVTTVKSGNTGETDHYTFDRVGIPGFQFIQDPLEYLSRTHHTNMDVYDHLSIEDLKQAAVVVASIVYHTAMRDEKLPRKPLPKPETWLFDGF